MLIPFFQVVDADPSVKKVNLKETLTSIANSLTAEELEHEAKCREQQMAAIFNLLSTHNEGIGVAISTDIKSQLDMYI